MAAFSVVMAARRYRGDSAREFATFGYKIALGEIRKAYLAANRLQNAREEVRQRTDLLDGIAEDDPVELRADALGRLSALERRVIALRYGLNQRS